MDIDAYTVRQTFEAGKAAALARLSNRLHALDNRDSD